MVEGFELDLSDGKWPFAQLSELASQHGGPQNLLDDLAECVSEISFEEGLIQGKTEGIFMGVAGTLAVAAIGLGAKYFIDKNKKKKLEAKEKFNEIFSQINSVLTVEEKEMIENKNTEFLAKVKELEDKGLNADEERAKFNTWMEEFLKSKGLGNK